MFGMEEEEVARQGGRSIFLEEEVLTKMVGHSCKWRERDETSTTNKHTEHFREMNDKPG